MEHFFQHIDGWFDFDDIYANAVREASEGAIFIEVGSWLGRSSAFMAVEIENSGKDIRFYCVDTWQGSPTEKHHRLEVQKSGGSIRSRFVSNMRGLDVVPIESDSSLAADRFEDESIDFVFIDAAHDFESVSRDIRSWYPKVKPGGVIAGHDIGWSGLFAAVQSAIPAKEIERRRSSWWHRKPPAVKLPEPLDFQSADAIVCIPWVNREDLLEKAILSVPSWLRVVVIDHGQDMTIPLPSGVTRLSMETRLKFSQIQNFMLRLAVSNGIKHLFFMHSDASCQAQVFDKLIETARASDEWGVIFTHYDVLAAFHVPNLLARVGVWDETFEWYRSDCDYYRRVRLAGLATADTGLVVHHTPSSTIGADPAEKAHVESVARWHKNHYLHKWGGENGGEKFSVPYNQSGK